MQHTYRAILVGDRLEFTGGAPQDAGPLEVQVTVIGTAGGSSDGNGVGNRGAAMAAALERLGQGALAGISDPVAWQRETRQERELPGR